MILTFLMGTGQAFCRPFVNLNLSDVSSWLNIGRVLYSRHTMKVICSQIIKSGSMWCWFILLLVTLTLIFWLMVVPAGFFNLYNTNILGWIVLCCVWGYCPVHYRIFSFIFNLNPLDVSSTPIPDIAKCPLGSKFPPTPLNHYSTVMLLFFFYS